MQLQAVEGQVPTDEVELRLSLARRQLALGDASAALLTLHALMAISPPRADVLLLAGRAERAQRHFAIAHGYFEQAERAAEGDDVLAARHAREGIEEADGNGRDVDKEIFPCVRGSMGRVHVKHEYGVLLNGK